MKFCVITSIGEDGNYAVALDLKVEMSGGNPEVLRPFSEFCVAMNIPPMTILAMRKPVFTLGEIVILDDTGGRELVGNQRMPSKWDVGTEHFDNIEDALGCADTIINSGVQDAKDTA